jgi:hypothetical protein
LQGGISGYFGAKETIYLLLEQDCIWTGEKTDKLLLLLSRSFKDNINSKRKRVTEYTNCNLYLIWIVLERMRLEYRDYHIITIYINVSPYPNQLQCFYILPTTSSCPYNFALSFKCSRQNSTAALYPYVPNPQITPTALSLNQLLFLHSSLAWILLICTSTNGIFTASRASLNAIL